MYNPSAFAITDKNVLSEFIQQNSFGLVISTVAGSPFASHLPLLFDEKRGAAGEIVGHMARANPQWEELDGQNVLAVFSGPHAYISPTWYEATHVVPTWNYAAVHATGRAKLVEDQADLLDIVRRTVSVHERTMPTPWTLDEDERFVDRMLAQIVGFRIEIKSLEGKWKLSQNHPAERRGRVADALRAQGGENALAIAAMMEQTLRGSTKHDG